MLKIMPRQISNVENFTEIYVRHEIWNFSKKLAKNGKLEHDSNELNEKKQGENLYMKRSSNPISDPGYAHAVDKWYAEIDMYDWNNPGRGQLFITPDYPYLTLYLVWFCSRLESFFDPERLRSRNRSFHSSGLERFNKQLHGSCIYRWQERSLHRCTIQAKRKLQRPIWRKCTSTQIKIFHLLRKFSINSLAFLIRTMYMGSTGAIFFLSMLKSLFHL